MSGMGWCPFVSVEWLRVQGKVSSQAVVASARAQVSFAQVIAAGDLHQLIQHGANEEGGVLLEVVVELECGRVRGVQRRASRGAEAEVAVEAVPGAGCVFVEGEDDAGHAMS